MTALRLEIGEKSYPAGGGRHLVLRDISLSVEEGQFLCILGPSGCGKTTLLNLIAGLDEDFKGRIERGETPGGKPGHPHIGYVFQNPTLLPWRTVLQNLRLVMEPEQIERGIELSLLEAMGLLAFKDAYPRSLSLGMSRRVALARAFAVEPDLLLMDEPFVSLDEATAQGLRKLLLETWQTKPTTVIFVTHDSREALQLAQRIIVLSRPPTRILQDHTIELSSTQRLDPRQIDALRKELLPGAEALI